MSSSLTRLVARASMPACDASGLAADVGAGDHAHASPHGHMRSKPRRHGLQRCIYAYNGGTRAT